MEAAKVRPYFLLAAVLGTAVLAFFIFESFLIPLTLAAVFAVVLYPVFSHINFHIKYRGFASLMTIIAGTVVLLIPLSLLFSLIISQAGDLYFYLSSIEGREYLASFVQTVISTLEPYIPGIGNVQSVIIADLGTYAQRGLGIIVNNLGSIASSITGFFISLFIFYFGLYYLLKDGPAFAKYVVELSPLSDTDDKAILKKLERAVNSVIRGNLTIAFLQGIMSGIGYTIFGLPNSVLWGTATGFAALVPGVGTSLVMIPAVLYLLFSGSLWAGVGLLIWGMTAVGLIDNFLGPKLIGRGAKLHTFVVLLSVLGGLAFFGPAGLFLGPIAMSLLFALLSIYSNKRSAE